MKACPQELPPLGTDQPGRTSLFFHAPRHSPHLWERPSTAHPDRTIPLGLLFLTSSASEPPEHSHSSVGSLTRPRESLVAAQGEARERQGLVRLDS